MNKKITIWLLAMLCLFALESAAQNPILVSGVVKSGKEKEPFQGLV